MQASYKEQKASNAAHLPPYWNVLSFSFTIIEFSFVISFRMVMQHTSPLAKGRKRGDYLCRTDVKNYKRWTHNISASIFVLLYNPQRKSEGVKG